jgi:undecaprenyl-diphosphatase
MPIFADVGLVPALVLGAVQGVTEFLPISSDGHLAIAAMLFGETDMPLAMVVLLHLGTLAATMIVLRDDVKALLATLVSPKSWRDAQGNVTEEAGTIRSILIASVPTAIVGLALHDVVEPWSRVPWIVGVCTLGSALAVGSTQWSARRESATTLQLPTWKLLAIGVGQGLAVLPGLSRSGTSIACAMALGVAGPSAFRLSFLMSMPAIAGAALLELRHEGVLAGLGAPAFAGTAVAFVVGLGALALLRRIVAQGRFWAFAVYLVPLGLGLIAYDAMH